MKDIRSNELIKLTITKAELKDLVQASDFAVSAVELGEVKTTHTKWHALRDMFKAEQEAYENEEAQDAKEWTDFTLTIDGELAHRVGRVVISDDAMYADEVEWYADENGVPVPFKNSFHARAFAMQLNGGKK